MRIAWVGISAQRDHAGKPVAPLAPTTPTGQVVEKIIQLCPAGTLHEKANFIDQILIDDDQRLRAPRRDELAQGADRFSGILESRARDLFVFFGGHIRSAFEFHCKVKFKNDIVHTICGSRVAFVNHPSYVRIYRAKRMDEYIRSVASLVSSLPPSEKPFSQ